MELYTKDGDVAGFREVIKWWLEKYEGMEHLTNMPESWYTVNTILKRCLKKMKPKD